MQGVRVAAEDTERGARVLYTVADRRVLDALRTDVQARLRPSTARASGGAPTAEGGLPPVEVQMQILPNGQAVTFTAGNEQDGLLVRRAVKRDVELQRRGACASLLVPMGAARAGMAERRALELTDVRLDPALVADCKLHEGHAQGTSDTTEQVPGRQPVLDRVAGCLTTGQLPGSRLEVVGHSPLVGPDEYKLRFGRTRAESVAQYLGGGGIDPKRIDVRNEQNAQPGSVEAASVEVRLSR
jgi:outer membrane protein OmpA-like peptidoglycan-associated protein